MNCNLCGSISFWVNKKYFVMVVMLCFNSAGLSLVSLLVRILQEMILVDFYPPDYAVTWWNSIAVKLLCIHGRCYWCHYNFSMANQTIIIWFSFKGISPVSGHTGPYWYDSEGFEMRSTGWGASRTVTYPALVLPHRTQVWIGDHMCNKQKFIKIIPNNYYY